MCISNKQINTVIKVLKKNEDRLSDGYEYYCYNNVSYGTLDEYKIIEVDDVLKEIAIDIIEKLNKVIYNGT